jgi:hypothetical protein
MRLPLKGRTVAARWPTVQRMVSARRLHRGQWREDVARAPQVTRRDTLIATAATLRMVGSGELGIIGLTCDLEGVLLRVRSAHSAVSCEGRGHHRRGEDPDAPDCHSSSRHPPKRSSIPLGYAVRHAFHDLCNDISKVAFDSDFTYQQGVNEALVVIDVA